LRVVGLIVNPIAGMGGAVGLKGTDGPEMLAKARLLGAKPLAPLRARSFLEGLSAVRSAVEFIAPPGEMGEYAFEGLGFRIRVLPGKGWDTGPEDTRKAASEMARLGVDIIAFCGGDGTARDVLDAIGQQVPALGIPAGVKMHSGVFAVSPQAAARIVVKFLWGELPLAEGEVADVDEEAFREGRLAARLYGYLNIPYEPVSVQGMKAATQLTDEVRDNMAAIARWIAERMGPGVAYILGPGTTVKAICEELGVGCSLLGVDVLIDGKVVAKDANEEGIIDAIRGRRATIIVSPIGRQGFIFGRGNQQISSKVISAVGRGGVLVIATRDKLEGMDTLKVDTGSAEADGALSGTVKVLVDYNSFRVFRVSAASEVDPKAGDRRTSPK